MSDVVIIGSGVAGNLAAAYLRRTLPDLDVLVIDRPNRNRPIVGESLVEVSTSFIRELGLSAYLVEKHYPKYGLTYYYKQHLDDPADRAYFVDESPVIPPFPAFQINRFTFDRDLQRMNAEGGVEFTNGWVVDISLDRGRHAVTIEDSRRQRTTHHCRWIIDASGRNRVIGQRLGLQTKNELQKDVFWFRLVDFDTTALSRIEAIKKENRAFSPYYCTHHFFGRGNWIWCIPMRSEEHASMISVGITYRRDLYPGEVRTLDAFLEHVGREHPVVTELTRSGTVADVNYYRSYMYECKQHYSPDGWFIIGDAGDTVDPLYSLGISLISLQVRQVAAAIERERRGLSIDRFTRDMDAVYTTMHRVATREITALYQWMHDPYCCPLLMHLSILASFHVAAPLIVNGYLWDPDGVRMLSRLADEQTARAALKPMQALMVRTASRAANRNGRPFIKVQSAFSLNYAFFDDLRDEAIPKSIADMYAHLVRLRLRLLRHAGWAGLGMWRQHVEAMKDLVRATLIRTFLNGTRLRENALVRRLIAASGAP